MFAAPNAAEEVLDGSYWNPSLLGTKRREPSPYYEGEVGSFLRCDDRSGGARVVGTAANHAGRGRRHPVCWSRNISEHRSLRNINKIPGAIEAMGYIGSWSNLFSFYVEDNGLASMC